jgi:putative transposase
MNSTPEPLQEKREAVAYGITRGLSERHACRLVWLSRSSARYAAHPKEDEPLIEKLRQIKGKHPRFGVRRAYWTLKNGGEALNHKRVQRLWKQQGLAVVRRKKKRRVLSAESSPPCRAEYPNHVWSYDFLEDALLSGRKYRLLNILDEFTRQWLALRVGFSLGSKSVIAVLEPLFVEHGAPRFLRSDNGPEFIALEVQAWLSSQGSGPLYIEPGKPWQNGHVESFGGKLRDEYLDREAFVSLGEASVCLEQHRRWYNAERPHSSLGYQSPLSFKAAWLGQRREAPPQPPGAAGDGTKQA